MSCESSPNNGVTGPAEAFLEFLRSLAQGSYPLFAAAIAAMIWANLFGHHYHEFWHSKIAIAIGSHDLTRSAAHWIDEALMALFFFVVGLEIKRELLVGGLSSPKQALLPVAAAFGGMVVPAVLYAGINAGAPTLHGWGIPMATDIAFALAVLGLLGRRVPVELKLFLSALAIADDLGAVLVIALFYTQTIQGFFLVLACVPLVILFVGNLMWVRWTPFYVFCGGALWLAVLGSGVHATVAGVLVAMFIPARGKIDTDTFLRKVRGHIDRFVCEADACGHSVLANRNHLDAVHAIDAACRNVETPLQRLEHDLHPWVAYAILPLFALANAGLSLGETNWAGVMGDPVTRGVLLGLILGKPLGIFAFTYGASRLMRAPLPTGIDWAMIAGAGMLGGIGFTMSLFITGLSFTGAADIDKAKLAIILASLIAGIVGYLLIRARLPAAPAPAAGGESV